MIKIAIIDDDKVELAKAKAQCAAYSIKHPEYLFTITTFEDASDFLAHLEGTSKYKGEIIFLTSSLSHAIEAFSVNATHYIVKPYTPQQFEVALDKALFQLDQRRNASILIKTTSGVCSLAFTEFLYAETDAHMQNVYLSEGRTIRVRMTSFELYNRVAQDRRFYKYGRAYILNLEKIQEITSKIILLDNEVQIQMQRRQYRPLIEKYTQFCLEGE